MLHSYPNVYQLGHKLVSNVLDGYVLVQEKIDELVSALQAASQ